MNRRLYLILQSAAWRSHPAPPPVIQKTDPSGSEQPATEGAMTNVRMNVYNLPPSSGDWPEWFTWYARGVKALQDLPMDDKLSWRFYAAIHGYNGTVWNNKKLLRLGERLPDLDVIKEYWNQCQHQTWFFLPWHRGYLYAMEEILRTEIVKQGGPSDWTLCYWNYFAKGQNAIPSPFLDKIIPGSSGEANPLYIPDRTTVISQDEISRWALKQPWFTGGLIFDGFGGPETGFSNFGRANGSVENDPHNIVHSIIGGLMGNPRTAAFDPIFWLHHANIDRLWETWVRSGGKNPTKTNWLNGPLPTTGRKFIIPRVSDLAWTFTPTDMTSLSTLGYSYESYAPLDDSDAFSAELDTQPAFTGLHPVPRSPFPAKPTGEGAMHPGTPELVGALDEPLTVVGYEADTVVEIDNSAKPKLTGLMAAPLNLTESDTRLVMRIDNVTGDYGAVTLAIFIVPPAAADPSGASDLKVGSIGLFGVELASDPDGPHAGQGVSFILDLTEAMSGQGWQGEDVTVRFVSLKPVPPSANITIGKISIYLQAG
ncbi:MAG TPA: tyrosinase family protein [Caulobacter sp.]|nr:tyrosinase family protein [Caulobacter sp.]